MIYIYIFLLFKGSQSVLQALPTSVYATHSAQASPIHKGTGSDRMLSAPVKKEVTDTRRQHRRAHLEMEGPGAQWAQASSWASSPGRGWSRRSHWRCRGQCDRCPFPPLHRTLSRPLCPWLRLHSSDLTSAALPKAPGCEVGTDPSGRRGQVSCRPP